MLAGKTVFITGGSRGIGEEIGVRFAREGANIVIAAKTNEPHPNLPGTIHTASKKIEEAGGKALAVVVDVRNEEQIAQAVKLAVEKFGGIDILINNASAINLTGTEDTSMKKYDLMMQVNVRGTFATTQACLPYLKKSANPHVINLSPPINLNPKWFHACGTAYTMSKYGMSMCVLGMAEEFREYKIAVNALWPRTAIETAALNKIQNTPATHSNNSTDNKQQHLALASLSRTPAIMAEAALEIVLSPSAECTGNFFLDEEVMVKRRGTTVDELDRKFSNCAIGTKLPDDFFLGDKPLIYFTKMNRKAKL